MLVFNVALHEPYGLNIKKSQQMCI